MTEEKKTTKKPAAAKTEKAPAKAAAKPASPKAEKAPVKAKVGAAPKVAKSAGKEKKAYSGPTLTVQQFGSKLGRHHDQEATLIGLGLNKNRRQRVLPDTPEVRGMIYKVRHLVKVIG